MSLLEAERRFSIAREACERGCFLDSYVNFCAAWIAGSIAGDEGASIDALREIRARIADFVVHVWTPRALDAIQRTNSSERGNQLRAVGITFLEAADYLAREADEGRVVADGKVVTRRDLEDFIKETATPINDMIAATARAS